MKKAPNILFIQVDQMHADCLGILGDPNLRTPHLDGLARAATLFSQAQCNNPICMPSRISMMSGQHCSTTLQFGFNGTTSGDLPWLPRVLKNAGYTTAAFGKFHTLCIGQKQWGFDVAAPTLPEDADLARPAGNHYEAYCRRHNAPWPGDQLHGHVPGRSGPPVYSSQSEEGKFWMHRHAACSDTPLEHSLERWTADRCIDFLRQPKDKPFFAWLSFDRPHYPTTLPREWFERIRPERVRLYPAPDADELVAKPPTVFGDYRDGASIYNLGETDFRFIVATYYTLIEFIDEEIGRVLACLKEQGLDDDTAIVFTSDHGDEAGRNGLYDKILGVLSDNVTRVPLIIRPAPSTRLESACGHRSDALVELVDLFPTLCSLAGVPAPTGLSGRDISPWLSAQTPVDRDRMLFCEDIYDREERRWYCCSVRFRDWRFVFSTDRAEWQLHDVSTDPDCRRNLIDAPDAQPVRIEIKRGLLSFLMRQQFGGYEPEDVMRIRDALSGRNQVLALCTGGSDHVTHFRAAAVVLTARHELLVPYYEAPMLLFLRGHPDGKDGYRRAEEAIAFDPTVVESMLDFALGEQAARVRSVSYFRQRPKVVAPTPQAARELVEKQTMLTAPVEPTS